jgi:hypothetical protein
MKEINEVKKILTLIAFYVKRLYIRNTDTLTFNSKSKNYASRI